MLFKVTLFLCLLATSQAQDSIINQMQNLTCTTKDGQTGECVPYYLCNAQGNIVNTDGIGVIDIAFQDGPCQSYIDTCCPVGEKRPPTDPITPKPEPNEPMREGCGWHNPNGVVLRKTGDEVAEETKFAEFPWMCAILKIEPEGQNLKVFIGGGSLIHPSVVLTAAHYVATAPSLRVRAGEWDTQSTKEPYPYQDREVNTVEIHKDFNKGNLFYNIAVLFLAKPMDLSPNVQLVCLPPLREKTVAGTRCYATGWGKDRFGKDGHYQVILRKIELPVLDHNTCQVQLRKTRLTQFFELHSTFMCAGGETDHDVCKADGGAPLSCPIESEPGRFAQAGIVAWYIGCGADGALGVYVDVANLRNWIDDKVSGKGYDPKVYSY